MKFKPVYLYGILSIVVILFLIIVSNQSGSKKTVENPVDNKGNIPNDEIHKPWDQWTHQARTMYRENLSIELIC